MNKQTEIKKLRASVAELLTIVERERTDVICGNCVWSLPEDGGEPEPQMDTLDSESREYLSELDQMIARARNLVGGSNAARN